MLKEAARAHGVTITLWAAAALLAGLDALVAWIEMLDEAPLYMAAMFLCLAMALWMHRERSQGRVW